MTDDDDTPEDREEMEAFNRLLDKLNGIVQEEPWQPATRALCIALRHALMLITDIRQRSSAAAICMNTLQDIPTLDYDTVERVRRRTSFRSYVDPREPRG